MVAKVTQTAGNTSLIHSYNVQALEYCSIPFGSKALIDFFGLLRC